MSDPKTSEEAKERHRQHMREYARERRLKLKEELGEDGYKAKCREDVARRKRGEYLKRPVSDPITDEERKRQQRERRRKHRERQKAEMGVDAYNAMINEKSRAYRKRVTEKGHALYEARKEQERLQSAETQ